MGLGSSPRFSSTSYISWQLCEKVGLERTPGGGGVGLPYETDGDARRLVTRKSKLMFQLQNMQVV